MQFYLKCLTLLAIAASCISFLRICTDGFNYFGKTVKSQLPTLDIVVSMYKEDLNKTYDMLEEIKALELLKNLTITTYVYTKDHEANLEKVQRGLNTTHVSVLVNAGREAGTYFTHILRHWNNLAKHTMFIQADMHELDGAKNRITDWFRPNSGVLPLGQLESCDCVNCRDSWDDTRTFPRIEELYSALNGEFCPGRIALSYFGQIVVSASRIRSRHRNIYQYLKSVLESDMDHFIHSDPRQGMFSDEGTNPYFGHTIERSYMVLWNCADDGIAKRCGGLSSLRSRRTSDQSDDHRQCIDQ